MRKYPYVLTNCPVCIFPLKRQGNLWKMGLAAHVHTGWWQQDTLRLEWGVMRWRHSTANVDCDQMCTKNRCSGPTATKPQRNKKSKMNQPVSQFKMHNSLYNLASSWSSPDSHTEGRTETLALNSPSVELIGRNQCDRVFFFLPGTVIQLILYHTHIHVNTHDNNNLIIYL